MITLSDRSIQVRDIWLHVLLIKIKHFPVYHIMVCGKQFCLRNKKKKKKTSALCEDRTDQIKLRDLRAAYCTNEVLTKFRGNKYMFKHFSIFFSHESTKPKNYISLLIRVPHCFFPKENTRQTLRHILALIIYVCIYIYLFHESHIFFCYSTSFI